MSNGDPKPTDPAKVAWFPMQQRLIDDGHLGSLTENETKAMLVIAMFQNFGSELCTAGMKKIAAKMCCDYRAAQRAVHSLQRKGYIELLSSGGGRSAGSRRLVLPPGKINRGSKRVTPPVKSTTPPPVDSAMAPPVDFTTPPPVKSTTQFKVFNSQERNTTTIQSAAVADGVGVVDLASPGEDGGKDAELSRVAQRLDELGIRGKKRKEILGISGITLKIVNHCDSATRNKVGMLIDMLTEDGPRLAKNGIPNAYAPLARATRDDDDEARKPAADPQAILDKMDSEEASREGITIEEFRERRRKRATEALEQFKKRFSAEQWKYLVGEYTKKHPGSEFPSDIAREYQVMQDIDSGHMRATVRCAEEMYPNPEKKRIIDEFRSGYSDDDWQRLTEAFNKANPMYHRVQSMREEAPFKMLELVKSGKLSIDRELQGVA